MIWVITFIVGGVLFLLIALLCLFKRSGGPTSAGVIVMGALALFVIAYWIETRVGVTEPSEYVVMMILALILVATTVRLLTPGGDRRTSA